MLAMASCSSVANLSARGWCRASCRVSYALPLRRPTPLAPKVHPATGLPLSRGKGQHLIHNVGVVQKMIQAAELQSFDSVYEVGCGTGELTVQLLPKCRRVHTVDVEPRMVQETEHRAASMGFTNLETKVGDALRLSMPRRFDVCVSNLPYQISSPFIFRLLRRLSDGAPWRAAVLMVQREFAERLLADPGEKPFSRLALGVRLFARTRRCFDVKPGSFIPAPQVHSTVIRLEPRIPAPAVDFLEWDAMIRLIFSRRRKTLHAQFRKISALSMLEQNYKIRCSLTGTKPSPRPFPEYLMSVLEEQGVTEERAFAMDIDDLHGLLQAFHRAGIYFVNVQAGGIGAFGQGSGLQSCPSDVAGCWDDEESTIAIDSKAVLAELGPVALSRPRDRVLEADEPRPTVHQGRAAVSDVKTSTVPSRPLRAPPPPPMRPSSSSQSHVVRPQLSYP